MSDKDTVLAPLEQWSSTLFLVAGALLVVYSVLFAAEAFMDTYPAVRGSIGPLGYIVGFAGLLGLYPALADRSPKLAGAGAVFAAIGAVGWLVSLAGRSGILSGARGAVDAIEALFILLGMILAFLVFSLASIRTDVYSRTVGLLLLGPFLVNGVNFGIVIAGYASPEGRFVTSGLWALSYLAIGIALRTEDVPSERRAPAPAEAQHD
jgi:hypothetical protein